jgi:hypothetical protein
MKGQRSNMDGCMCQYGRGDLDADRTAILTQCRSLEAKRVTPALSAEKKGNRRERGRADSPLSMITGDFPPSSRSTGVSVFAHSTLTAFPTAPEPVKKTEQRCTYTRSARMRGGRIFASFWWSGRSTHLSPRVSLATTRRPPFHRR